MDWWKLAEEYYDNVVAVQVKELEDGKVSLIITRGIEMPEIILVKTLDNVKGMCYTKYSKEKKTRKGKSKKEVD
jgi:hypothetical protein